MRFSQTSGIPDGITIKDLLSNFTSYENDFKFISNIIKNKKINFKIKIGNKIIFKNILILEF
jgi:hypothetical protein